MTDYISYSASDARQNFYDLLRKVGAGGSYEINLRGHKPVILVSKEEVEGLLETLDIMSSPEEVRAIEAGKREKGGIPLEKLLKEFEDEDGENHPQKVRSQRVQKTSQV